MLEAGRGALYPVSTPAHRGAGVPAQLPDPARIHPVRPTWSPRPFLHASNAFYHSARTAAVDAVCTTHCVVHRRNQPVVAPQGSVQSRWRVGSGRTLDPTRWGIRAAALAWDHFAAALCRRT